MDKLNAPMIEKILLNKFDFEESRSRQLTKRMYEAIGLPAKIPTQQEQDFGNQVRKLMAKSISIKLMTNDRSVPLNSVDSNMEELFLTFVGTMSPDDADQEFKACIERAAKPMLNNILNMFAGISVRDPYDEMWQMINVIQVLVNEEMLSIDQPLSGELYDEVIRRVYTREEYVIKGEKSLKLITNPETLINAIIEPMIDSLQEDIPPELMEEFEMTTKEEIFKEIEPVFKKLADITNVLLLEEADRIYKV